MSPRNKAAARAQIFARWSCLALDFWRASATELLRLDAIGDEPTEAVADLLDDVADFGALCRDEADALGRALTRRPAA